MSPAPQRLPAVKTPAEVVVVEPTEVLPAVAEEPVAVPLPATTTASSKARTAAKNSEAMSQSAGTVGRRARKTAGTAAASAKRTAQKAKDAAPDVAAQAKERAGEAAASASAATRKAGQTVAGSAGKVAAGAKDKAGEGVGSARAKLVGDVDLAPLGTALAEVPGLVRLVPRTVTRAAALLPGHVAGVEVDDEELTVRIEAAYGSDLPELTARVHELAREHADGRRTQVVVVSLADPTETDDAPHTDTDNAPGGSA